MEEEELLNSATLKDGFAGNRRFLKGFLAKINLIFMLYPDRYNNEETKVVYLISRLYGNAMNWAASLIEKEDPCLYNYNAFVEKLKAFYGDNDAIYIANQNLRRIKQNKLGGIRGYILEFNKYSDESNWNEEAKMDAFMAGLHHQIAIRILEMYPGPKSLTALQTIASRIDSRLCTQQSFLNNHRSNSKNQFVSTSENKSHKPISKDERERRQKENLCFYCGEPYHKSYKCPKKERKNKDLYSLMAIPHQSFRNKQTSILEDQQQAKKQIPEQPVMEFNLAAELQTELLIDCGSKYNLIDEQYCKDFKIGYYDDDNLPKIIGIGGKQAIVGITQPITISYKDHVCQTCFYVTDLPFYTGLLGSDWLRTHNPYLNFSTNELTFNSEYCRTHCLRVNPYFVEPSNKTTYINYNSSAFSNTQQPDAVPLLPVIPINNSSSNNSNLSSRDLPHKTSYSLSATTNPSVNQCFDPEPPISFTGGIFKTMNKFNISPKRKSSSFKSNDNETDLIEDKKIKLKKYSPFKIKKKTVEPIKLLHTKKTRQTFGTPNQKLLQERIKQSTSMQITISDDDEYEVEEILGERKHYRKTQYLLKWKGYPLSEASWEPEANLNCPELLKIFKSKNKKNK